MAEKIQKKSFIWKSLRISFWAMIGLWIITSISELGSGINYDSAFWVFISLIWIASTLFTFVVSIIHLTKYKKKGLAVTALVISSILILLFLIGILALLYSPSLI